MVRYRACDHIKLTFLEIVVCFLDPTPRKLMLNLSKCLRNWPMNKEQVSNFECSTLIVVLRALII